MISRARPQQLLSPATTEVEPPLSPARAFIVQFREGVDLAHGSATGRVEHVLSGQAERFASLAELLAFFERILTTLSLPAVVAAPGRVTEDRYLLFLSPYTPDTLGRVTLRRRSPLGVRSTPDQSFSRDCLSFLPFVA